MVDAIELFNTTSNAIDVTGWYLTDDPGTPWKYRITNGVIQPFGYLVFDEGDFNPTPGIGNSFSLSSLGDEVYLFSGNAAFELTGYSHGSRSAGLQKDFRMAGSWIGFLCNGRAPWAMTILFRSSVL
jgi:hypothetical protein